MNGLKDMVFSGGAQYQGTVDDRFKDLATHFSRLQGGRTDQGGAALCVYYKGQVVVDIYTGLKSAQSAWQADTLSICYSTGKGVLSSLAHILVSQGVCDYDTPIVDYWPEFAQPETDKARITLRHILSHQTGLFDIRNIITSAIEMADWQHMLQVIEQAQPRFAVGKDSAYQAFTYGWLLGGLLEKASKRSLSQLMQDELVGPLNLDGAYFGVPSEQMSRVANPLQHAPAMKVNESAAQASRQSTSRGKAQRKVKIPEKLLELSGQNPKDFLDAMVPHSMRDLSFFSPQGMQAVIPAANGAFTAHSLAKIYAMLAQHGEWERQQLISPRCFAALAKIQSYKRDRVMPIPMKWRLGYHRVISLGKRVKSGFGHLGYNGSGAWCDPQRGLSFAYTHNFPVASITGDYRLWSLTQEALRCADAQLKGHKGWF